MTAGDRYRCFVVKNHGFCVNRNPMKQHQRKKGKCGPSMWTSVVYIQARSERPLWPIILLLVIFLILLNMQAFRWSSPTAIYDFNINMVNNTHWTSSRLRNSNNSDNVANLMDDFDGEVIELPRNMMATLKMTRRTVLREVARMQPPLDLSNHIPGDNMLRILIVTTWMSGASFLGQYLASHPATFYFSEPLAWARVSRFTDEDDPETESAIDFMDSFMHCDFSYAKNNWEDWPRGFQYEHIHSLRQLCSLGKWKSIQMCVEPLFLNYMCAAHPLQIMKSVRMNLNITRPLIKNIDNLKVIYIVRDPRATLNSRKSRPWCDVTESCKSPRLLCKDLVNDYYSVLELQKAFPGRIKVLRYEDLSLEMGSTLAEVSEFVGLGMQQQQRDFVYQHTHPSQVAKKQYGDNTYREPRPTALKWRKESNFTEVATIQDSCHEALRLWGYREAKDEFDLFRLDPVLPLEMPEILPST